MITLKESISLLVFLFFCLVFCSYLQIHGSQHKTPNIQTTCIEKFEKISKSCFKMKPEAGSKEPIGAFKENSPKVCFSLTQQIQTKVFNMNFSWGQLK